jgi:hypothetical protein
MPNYKEYAAGAGMVNAYAAVQQARAIKNVKSYRDPRTGKTIDVYVVETAFTGTVGPAVAQYNDVTALQIHDFAVDPSAIFLDVKLFWNEWLNDLDLYLQRDVNGTYVEVAGSQDIQALSMAAREGVAVDFPAGGNWRTEVRGWTNAPQAYSVTVQQYFPIR